MVKYYCDRCGKELEDKEEIGLINIETRILVKDNGVSYNTSKYEDKQHYLICQNCIKGLNEYVKSVLDS